MAGCLIFQNKAGLFLNFTIALVLAYMLAKFNQVMDMDNLISGSEDINTEATPTDTLKDRWANIFRHPVEREIENRPIDLNETLKSS